MATDSTEPTGSVRAAYRRWFLAPPRAHGEILEDRTVGFLELFYDLVFVVLVGRAATALAEDVTPEAVGRFVVVFTLIWIAWMNGSLYHELHGREDGRHRALIFVQMGLLGVLGRYVGEATTEGGHGFAITYTLLMLVLLYQWWAIRRIDSEEYRTLAGVYLIGMAAGIVLMALSVTLGEHARLLVWTLFAIGWVIGPAVIFTRPRSPEVSNGVRPTGSMVERFDLFTIIVLGEVVVAVVDGLASAPDGAAAKATGVLALVIGFGYWWNYFDLIGGQLPRPRGPGFAVWLYGHLLLTLAITAAGAAMLGLVEHGAAAEVAGPTRSLLVGATAVVLVVLAVILHCLEPVRALDTARGKLTVLLLTGAAATALLGLLPLRPWLFAAVVVAVQAAIWGLGFTWNIRLQARQPEALSPGTPSSAGP